MDRFDRYLFVVFLRYWVVVSGAVLGTFLVLHLLGNSDELGQFQGSKAELAGDLLRWIGFNLPYRWLEFGPFLTLIAGLATVMHLAKRREWTPVLTSGRSAMRAVLPLLLGALLLGMLSMLVREQVQPRFAEARLALEWKLDDQAAWVMKDLSVRSRDDQRLLARSYRPAEGLIEGLEVYAHGSAGEDVLVVADSARWSGDQWDLPQGGRRIVPGQSSVVVDSFRHDELGPADLLRAAIARASPLDLSSAELREVLERDSHHRLAATLLWAWRAAPFSHLVLLLLGIPFVLRFDRRSSMEGLGYGLLLSILYFVAEILLRDLGGRGAVPPVLGGCGALVLFAGVAAVRWTSPGSRRAAG
ncbi:MAG: LptF/LptG family permease [Planctomycetes bacterium]|nr:LptF/LptG family permease [Planctomycetota bacterium]